METTAERIASSVRAELARAGLTGTDLARHMEWHQSSASRRLSGAVEFTGSELVRVAAYLGVSVSRLIPEDVAA